MLEEARATRVLTPLCYTLPAMNQRFLRICPYIPLAAGGSPSRVVTALALLSIALLSIATGNADASQAIVIEQREGSATYSLNDVSRLTFEAGFLIVRLRSGSETTWDLRENERIRFEVNETPTVILEENRLPLVREIGISATPNPVLSAAFLRYHTAAREPTTVTIHRLDGRKVRTLADRSLGSDEGLLTWDGRDDSGARVAFGMYFARIAQGGKQASTKLVVLR